jgi:carbamoyltransferase
VQTVTPDDAAEYYALLRAFKAMSGIGVLLNTSLNRRGEPIVETPTEALELFLATPLDALVIEGRLLIKTAVADADAAGSRVTTARQLGVS